MAAVCSLPRHPPRSPTVLNANVEEVTVEEEEKYAAEG